MKTVCVYHSRDLDGWMSAAIVKYFYNTKKKALERTRTLNGGLDFIGWDYGDEIPDLSDYDKVIMVDISFPKEEMKALSKYKKDFIWIDHHISAINENNYISGRWANGDAEDVNINRDKANTYVGGIRDDKYASCELTWKYFFPDEDIPEIIRLLGRYDCFGHKSTDEEQKVLEFQYGARAVIGGREAAYSWLISSLNFKEDIDNILDIGKSIYQYLCTEAKQAYAKAFPIEFKIENGNVVYGITPTGNTRFEGVSNYNFLCVNQDRFNPMNFGIDYHKDGYDGFTCFWYKDGKWSFSLYNDNGEVDCSTIAKQYGGGGHKGAAGFVTDNLNKIIK